MTARRRPLIVGLAVTLATACGVTEPPLPPPTVSITANGATRTVGVTNGSPVMRAWSSQHATSCTATGDWSGQMPLSGTAATDPLAGPDTLMYGIACQSPAGMGRDSVFVLVSAPTLGVSLSANPDSDRVPLSGMDLTATVSGTAVGDIRYRFDCTNDGVFEVDVMSASASYIAVDACSYSAAGTFAAKVLAERQGVSAEDTASIIVSPPTLYAFALLDPSSGTAPLLGVNFTGSVAGGATGDIRYQFDCHDDGRLEGDEISPNPVFIMEGQCDYPNPGTYVARLRATRQGVTAEGVDTVTVAEAPPTLEVSLAADPASGLAPLSGVDLTATVSGTATGDIDYLLDCTSDGTFELDVTSPESTYTAVDACSYPSAGNYVAWVRAYRESLWAWDSVHIAVAPPTLTVSLSAHPDSGRVPLSGVDLTATVSGMAPGEVRYRFDCTSDGRFDVDVSSPQSPYTAADACTYPLAGRFVAKVRVEQQGAAAEDADSVLVSALPWYEFVLNMAHTSQLSGGGAGAVATSYGDSCTWGGLWSEGLQCAGLAFSTDSGEVFTLHANPIAQRVFWGSSVTLADASVFEGWSGACRGVEDCQVTMSGPMSVTATFRLRPVLWIEGSGAGSVTSSPPGIDCLIQSGTRTGTCVAAFDSGTIVTLTETPASGSRFSGWGGLTGNGEPSLCIDAGTTCQLTMSETLQVFLPQFSRQFELTVLMPGSGEGAVYSWPPGISCEQRFQGLAGTCAAPFDSGWEVKLTPTTLGNPGGSVFEGWSGACAGTGTCQVIVSASDTATATYMRRIALSIFAEGSGSGTVTSIPPGIDCHTESGTMVGDCVETYLDVPAVTLTATAGTRSLFAGWVGSGACPGTGPCTLAQGAEYRIGASFAANFEKLYARRYQTCGLTGTGMAYCWGTNDRGQLGDGTTIDRNVPVPVAGGHTFVALAVGGYHSCGITGTGTAYCWGDNGVGQLGNGTQVPTLAPVPVTGGLSFVAITAGQFHSCGVTAIGTAYCWGLNSNGQLGDGTKEIRTAPAAVTGDQRFVTLAAGYGHTCGLTSGGAAYCWGSNSVGQLGTPSTDTSSPVAVTGGVHFVALAAGAGHTCGLDDTSSALCWGGNGVGQLGDGTSLNRTSPTPVASTDLFSTLAAADLHTCARTAAGKVYCWGDNFSAQLGNGTTSGSVTPALVLGDQAFVILAAGEQHSCGVSSDSVAFCWGTGPQLGDGVGSRRLIPWPVK